MLGTREKERTGSSASLSSKVEVAIFTPEQSGEDGLGPRSLTQSHSVSRSDLDFRNFVQLPCAGLADAPPLGHFPMQTSSYKKDL